MTTSKRKNIRAANFDLTFDEGDVTEHLNLKSVKVRYPVQRISIDFPVNILEKVDIEASKIGVTRTSLIKMWIAQLLFNQHAKT